MSNTKEEFPLMTREEAKLKFKCKSTVTLNRYVKELGVKPVKLGGKTFYNREKLYKAAETVGL